MKILSIETSCDETAIAMLECGGGIENPSFKILGNTLLSQAQKQAEFGGVYPNLAKRLHSQNLIPILKETLKEAKLLQLTTNDIQQTIKNQVKEILEREPELLEQFENFVPHIEKPPIDAIAVTQGPGLEPALWVGLNFAKALSIAWGVPLVPVNHMEGHILSVLVQENNTQKIKFPAIALLISGGHTQLVLVRGWMDYEIIGETRDDAVGEAFDKSARILGLPYPGGPEISKLAEQARKNKLAPDKQYTLPRPMIHSGDYDFSFSGLKTAVLYLVKKLGDLTDTQKQIIAREFEDAVVDVLVKKTGSAIKEKEAKALIIGGGVIANRELRNAFGKLAKNLDVELLIPDMSLTTDNAVMIGIAGYMQSLNESKTWDQKPETLQADGNLRLA